MTTFIEATTPTASSAESLCFNVPADWLQGRGAFGGLLAAMGLVAMRELTAVSAPLRTLQTTFIGPVAAGTSTVEARILRTGKSVTHVEAKIFSAGDLAAQLIAVFGSDRESSIAISLPHAPVCQGPEDLKPLPYIPGIAPSFLQHFDQRWAAGAWPFSGTSETSSRIWLKHRHLHAHSEISFVALADALPSPAISMFKKPAAASSLTWSLELVNSVNTWPSGYARIDSQLLASRNGYASQSATIYAPDGTPAALSRQVVTVFA